MSFNEKMQIWPGQRIKELVIGATLVQAAEDLAHQDAEHGDSEANPGLHFQVKNCFHNSLKVAVTEHCRAAML